MSDHKYRLVGIDPGSSNKGWMTWTWQTDGASGPPSKKHYRIEHLDKLIDSVCTGAAFAPVLVSIDAPIRAYGGIQAPDRFAPSGVATEDASWPFCVNPFSQRPIEKALSSVPRAANYSGLRQVSLIAAIGSLLGWTMESRPNRKNCSFVKAHDGVSVLGYMGAPHAPVVRTFLARLHARAEHEGVHVDYDTALTSWRPGTVTIMESHPAVSLGLLASMRTVGFPLQIETYKKNENQVRVLGEAFVRYFARLHGVH